MDFHQLEELSDQHCPLTDEGTCRQLHTDPLQNLPRIHPPEYYMREKNKQKKKRRCINPKNMPELRVLRRDIRRKYGEMMINVLNGMDVPLCENFFKEFGIPDLQTVRRSEANNLSSAIDVVLHNGQYPGSSNLEKFIDTFAVSTAMMPDWTFKVQDCQIHMRQGYQGSVIVMKTMMKATRVFSVKSKGAMEELEIVVGESDVVSDECSVTSRCSSYNPFEERSFKRLEEAGYIDRRNYEWIIADPPLDTTAEVIFMMILDEMHRISQFHINLNLISERPVAHSYH